MGLIGVFFVPHGSIILDPSKNGVPDTIQLIHDKMVKIGELIKELNPDICLVVTPHGISLSNDYGFYSNLKAEGTAEWEDEYKEYSVKIDLDQKRMNEIFQFLKENNFPVSTITSYASTVNSPLRWGEVVPLWFLRSIILKYVIMSIPTRRYDQPRQMIPELLKIGHYLSDYFASSNEKAIIIISGDLAHTHSQEGPYEFSEKAEQFDCLIEKWVKSGDKRLLLNDASEILDQALCCGYTGLVLLQGILEKTNLKSNFLIRAHPTYYGMLVASFS